MAVIDYFCHLDENLNIKIEVVDADKQPLDVANIMFEFATAIDQTAETIQTLTSNNGISVLDANTGTIQIAFNPTVVGGFPNKNLIYQLRMIDQEDEKTVYQYGRIFIEPTLFTD